MRTLHEIGAAVTVTAHDVELFRYTYRPDTPAFECPTPYFHPLRTLAGEVVTGNRPHDHPWHKGLAMTASHVSGQNFWGGVSWVTGEGYRDLPNVGTLRHRDFATLDDGAFTEHVDWITAAGEHWIDETRTVTVRDIDPAGGSWTLEFGTELRNVRGAALEFGSPTVFGRELAGYCGFFWRGPRSFTGGDVLASDDRRGQAMMGERGTWLAFTGRHDETLAASTLLFLDHPSNADHPPHWFVRTEPIPVVNPSLAFFEPTELADGDVLRLAYRVVVADGAWDAERIEKHLAAHPW
ncbi:MAG TPA: PmoA family protein [Pseudonocardiaceae bacterium]